MSELEQYQRQYHVNEADAGLRLDQYLVLQDDSHSRARYTQWIKSGYVQINDNSAKPKDKIKVGDRVCVSAEIEAVLTYQPEPVAFGIAFEDDALIVVNKPADLVVHPAAGNHSGTLLNGLLAHCPDLEKLPRAGIIHRLDKGTTGLMVVAKTLTAQTSLSEQLQARKVKRAYTAICAGEMLGGGIVDAPIGRDPNARTKMAVIENGKFARTHYQIQERFHGYTCLSVQLETGRTHQIRVHMAYQGHPLLGDTTYEGRKRLSRGLTPEKISAVQTFPRPALHATKLGFVHPERQEEVLFEAPLPKDMTSLMQVLRGKGDA